MKVLLPRSLFPWFWGRICPIETPEGESCGLVRNMATFSLFSHDIDQKYIIVFLESLGLKKFERQSELYLLFKNYFFVILNDVIIGFHDNVYWLIYCIK